MWGKSVKNITSKVYPAVGIALGAGLILVSLGFAVGWLQIEIDATPQAEMPPIAKPSSSGIEDNVGLPAVQPSVTPGASSLPPTTIAQDTPSSSQNADAGVSAARQGALRVSNQTEYPVRVVLLARQSARDLKLNKSGDTYNTPAHWDFAPGEGASQGLLLSLPNMSLKLKKGDILVAFAQDGSRRYWGPYVVGDTPAPAWRRAEWQLILQP